MLHLSFKWQFLSLLTLLVLGEGGRGVYRTLSNFTAFGDPLTVTYMEIFHSVDPIIASGENVQKLLKLG